MNLLSEIISKPVLNLYSGKIEGTVKDAIFDSTFKKIQFLKIFDDDEEEYLLSTAKIYSVGSSSLVIRNSEALLLDTEESKENNPINFEIFSSAGDSLGTLLDIELENNFEVKNLITQDGSIPQSNIVNISKIIIVNNTDKKIKFSNFKPKFKKGNTVSTNKVKIMPTKQEDNSNKAVDLENQSNVIAEPELPNNLPVIETPQSEQENFASQNSNQKQIEQNLPPQQKETFKISTAPTPQRVVGNGNFLIGRKVVKTIYGLNNEIIIKKDNIINAKNLESAKKHSKLVELTVFSKMKA